MIKNVFSPVIVCFIVSLPASSATAEDYLIWDACESPSAEILNSLLLDADYSGTVTDDIRSFIDNLDLYSTLFVFDDPHGRAIPWNLLEEIKNDISNYVANGGSIYWEGVHSALFHDYYRDTIFGFDITTCINYPFEVLYSVDVGPLDLSMSTVSMSAPGMSGERIAFENPDDCPAKAVYKETPYRAMICSFGISSLTDSGRDSRAEFVRQVMEWLLYMVDIDEKNISAIPAHFEILGNYPNPFNSQTAIRYRLTSDSNVAVDIYDLLGDKVAGLLNEKQGAGEHQVLWDAGSLPTGVYFYRIQAGSASRTCKMMFLK